MKYKVVFLFFAILMCFVISSFTRLDYDLIDSKHLFLDSLNFNQVTKILKYIGKDIQVKTYIPPDGDTELYDKIRYHENNDIKITIHELKKEQSIASILLRSSKYSLRILNKFYKVGQPVTVLSIFEKSYSEFSQRLQTHDPQKEICLYITILDSIKNEEGILAFTIKNDVIVEISLSFHPA